ncbi:MULTISPECIES: hypothetical protein [Halobacteriovorax]|uniref:hypothetical protein n=1 Tax=Halobacteriovorax TaxID=1652133 RepID=UPI001314ABA8|nr:MULTISPECIES: hypothetical protein [Halobacteriovorax]
MKSFIFILVLSLFTVGCASKQKINENCTKTTDSSGLKQCKKSHSANDRVRN